ncbi:MAG: hypothetical protein J1G06_04440 [Oscillospiraceae bacterium]|nr:hypothetical protein [Oscillospiraceae bacterium]
MDIADIIESIAIKLAEDDSFSELERDFDTKYIPQNEPSEIENDFLLVCSDTYARGVKNGIKAGVKMVFDLMRLC